MSGQLSAVGAQTCTNKIGGIIPPVISSSAPTWVPGLDWIDTASTPTLMAWNTSTWVNATTMGLYIALLTADPTLAASQNGGYAMNISDLVEDATAGYARQSVTFAEPPAYSGGTTYTLGQQVFYQSYLYQCAVNSVTGTAPPGTEGASNASWTYVSNGYPAVIANTNVLTYSYTAAQQLPVAWAALVTCASGSLGLLKYMWALPQPQQVAASQSIQIGAGLITIGQS